MNQFKNFDETKQTHEVTIKIRLKTDPVIGAYHDPQDFAKLFASKLTEIDAEWYHLQITDTQIERIGRDPIAEMMNRVAKEC